MPPAKLSATAAVLGGLLWVAHAVVGGGDDPLSRTLFLLGMVLLVLAAGIFGTSLVRSDAVAMRVVVGGASGLLLLALVEAFRPRETPWYLGAWGILAIVVGGLALLRGRGRSPDGGGPAHGAHAR